MCESVYVFRPCGWQLLVQVELVVSHLVNCRGHNIPSTTLCIAISHDEEHFASSGREGIPTPGAMSRNGPVLDELAAVPPVNERINIEVVSRISEVCDSKINATISVDDVWAASYIRRVKSLEGTVFLTISAQSLHRH